MKVVCADCAKEGKPALIREKEPLDDPTITHGMCADHCRQLYQEMEIVRKQRAVPWSRQSSRLPVSLRAVGQSPQASGLLRGTVRNICDGGLMVEFPVEVPPGSLLRVLIERKRGPLEMEGRVVWATAIHSMIGHGVVFREPQGEDFALELFLGERR